MPTINTTHNKYWKRFQSPKLGFLVLLFAFFSGSVIAANQQLPVFEKELILVQALTTNQAATNENLVTIRFSNLSIAEALEQLAEKIRVGISYNPAIMPDKRVSFDSINVPPHEVIYKLLEGTNLEPVLPPSKDVIVIREKENFIDEEIVQETIRGTVVDARTGELLPGVNIVIQGTTSGTTTNIDGEFELNVPSLEERLVFSYIGYQRMLVDIAGQTELRIELIADVAQLDDLVVVGYGVQRRSEITGSVGIVNADQIKSTSFNALQGIQGQVAGVQIFQNSGSPSGSNRVLIRGTGTINASTDPLFIVDGVAMEGGINFLNPNDIESIEVLKDASATAIYGARGANGVILISTTRGGTGERLTVAYDNNVSIGRMRGRMDVMNAEEFMEVQRIGLANVPLWRGGEAPVHDPSLDPFLFDANGNPLYDTDWQREATRTAFSQDHNLRIQGGTDRSSIGAVLNVTNREGIFLNNYMNRYSMKVTYDVQPREWLRMGTNVTYARIDENHLEEGGGGQEVRRTIIEMAPILPITWGAGSPRAGEYTNSTQVNSLTLEGQSNPVHRLLEEDRLRERNNLFGNTYIAVQINENLEFRTQLGINNERYEERRYRPSNLVASGGFPDGRANYNTNEVFYWQNENFLTYTQDFTRSRVTGVLGASWQERRFRSFGQEVFGFADDFFRFNNFGAATGVQSPNSNAFEWSLNSYFNRITYSYDDTYVLTFTSRVDGSSRFGADNKYGFFPSAGFAWNITNEEFMSDVNFIDLLRFRTSYGVTGNTEIGVFTSLATIGSGTTLLGGGRQSSAFTTRLPNPNLEWEKTYQFNVGTDIQLFNQALDIELDYYYKFTKDLILNRPVPATTGFTTIVDNIGAVSNQGIDLRISTQNIRTRDFFWSTTLNLNYNRNRVERLGAGDEDIFPGPNWVSGSQTILRVGEPVGNFYGFIRQGTWSTDEAAEAAARGFLPGEAKRSLDRAIIGNGLPDFIGSFINTFNFRNFDFLVDLQFVLGADIMQQFLHTAEDRQALTNGLRTQLVNAWTPDNQDTMYQRIRHQPLAGQNTQADSHWIVDGSYIRGNLLQVGYNFNLSRLDRLGLNRLRINASLENAFVIHSSDFKGHDPEASSWGGNIHAQNIFFYQYPRPRTASLGVQLEF
ncbi:MAG: SusC/RagA family TonB-linked outer membrane protein [Balneolaceae bacterium]|nr:SusC/RagA family TonB-linked outer membrane protein [Balneolaceae bacterium]